MSSVTGPERPRGPAKTLLGNFSRSRAGCAKWCEPRSDGLPSWRVLTSFPLILLGAMVILVVLGITGSSTGIFNQYFSSSSDPDLLAGTPQPIRSDEWLVQTTLVISQVEQGLPTFNKNFPGGTDSTVQSDLPSRDWSMAFRPHLVGFLLLPLDNAMSLRWWLPGFAMMAACFAFIVTMLPRRPIVAALFSVGFFFSPFFQWWYLPITFWPAVWAFLVMTAALWLTRGERRGGGILFAALAGYTTVTMVVGVYVPFIVPAVLVAFAFVVGTVLPRGGVSFLASLKSIVPLVGAGLIGAVVVGVWFVTRWETIERFVGTLYPGQRFTPTGTLSPRALLSLIGGPFTRNLASPTLPHIDANASEASTFFLIGCFLLVPTLIMMLRGRRQHGVDWIVVSMGTLALVFLAYLLIPGWDALSRFLLLDRTTAARLRIGIGLISLVFTVLYIRSWDDHPELRESRLTRAVGWGTVGAVVVYFAVIIVALDRVDASISSGSRAWIVFGALFLVSVLCVVRGWAVLAAVACVALSMLCSGLVNPLYRGVYDLNDTTLVETMESLPKAETSDWIGVGNTFLPTAVLVQSGLHSYNGFQSAPSPTMWKQIDPEKNYEVAWNRLANVSWVEGAGSPVPRNTQADTIVLNFDACSSFVQANVEYVLSDKAIMQQCVTAVDSVQEGPSRFWIYKVTGR